MKYCPILRYLGPYGLAMSGSLIKGTGRKDAFIFIDVFYTAC